MTDTQYNIGDWVEVHQRWFDEEEHGIISLPLAPLSIPALWFSLAL